MYLETYALPSHDTFRIKDYRLFNTSGWTHTTLQDSSKYIVIDNTPEDDNLDNILIATTTTLCWSQQAITELSQLGAKNTSNILVMSGTQCMTITIWSELIMNYPDVIWSSSGGGTGGGSFPEINCSNFPGPHCFIHPSGWIHVDDPNTSIPTVFTLTELNNEFANPCITAASQKLSITKLTTLAEEMGMNIKGNNSTEEWSLSFREGRGLLLDNLPALSLMIPIPATNVIRIVLDPTYFEQATQPNQTQEIAGQLIVHELFHGFIYVYKEKFGLTTLGTFNTHEVMFKQCVNAMRNILMRSFNISQEDATALALQGFEDVLEILYNNGEITDCDPAMNDFAVEHYGMSLTEADVIYSQYWNGTKGVKCF